MQQISIAGSPEFITRLLKLNQLFPEQVDVSEEIYFKAIEDYSISRFKLIEIENKVENILIPLINENKSEDSSEAIINKLNQIHPSIIF